MIPLDKIVIDTSSILAGFQFDGTMEYFIPPLAADEIRRGQKKEELDGLIERETLKVQAPSLMNMDKVTVGAQESGDINRMSRADMEIVALAFEIDAVIISDDYSIQNLAKKMNVEYRPFGKNAIREEFQWTYRCKGCGKFYEKEQRPDCPICGSEVVMKRKRGG
jgi:UPF0271 protein